MLTRNLGYEIQTSKKGDNYFFVLRVGEEVIITIISPPIISGTNLGMGGVNASEISGDVDIMRKNDITYSKPIVIFNHNNKAGLKLENILSIVETKLKENDPYQHYYKVDYSSSKAANDKSYQLKEGANVTVGKTIVEVTGKEVILTPIPKLMQADKDALENVLEYTINTLYGSHYMVLI